MSTEIATWQPDSGQLIPASAKTPAEVANYAIQLTGKDKLQIASAFGAGHYEMALNHLWGKTIVALKKELSTVGVGLLGEMLGKVDVPEDADVDDLLTVKDTIRLAEELGIVSATDGLRLQHVYELLSHFSQLEFDSAEVEEIDEAEALASLKTCVKSVLGRPRVAVASRFVDFRGALEGETLSAEDGRVETLAQSPYFFLKLTVSVLMNGAKRNLGAQLEHVLANSNVVIPKLWPRLREAEKWQVGHAYADAYANGRATAVSGLKSCLLKVRGFDYVPETLRSDTFIKAADAIIRAHEGLNNFYNEAGPVSTMAKLGSVVPPPAVPACTTALLCVVLGNRWGVAWNAQADAKKLLSSWTSDRWRYYLEQVLPSEPRILNKLSSDKPLANFVDLVKTHDLTQVGVKNKSVVKLLKGAQEDQVVKVREAATALIFEYYGKQK